MRRKEFIDLILNGISDTFDIYHNYWFKDRKFVVYAYSCNNRNKYETTNDAKLWDSKSFEHMFFINCDNLGESELDDLYRFAIDEIEPHFVRGDGKNPPKNHLYSHISFIIITRNKIQNDVSKKIISSDFKKNYMFGARGFSNIRLACVTPREYEVITNKAGKEIKDFLMEILLKIKNFED